MPFLSPFFYLLLKAYHLHTVITTRLGGSLSSYFRDLKAPRKISGPSLLLFGRGIKLVMFYAAVHKEPLLPPPQLGVPANANKGCSGECPSFAKSSSLGLQYRQEKKRKKKIISPALLISFISARLSHLNVPDDPANF